MVNKLPDEFRLFSEHCSYLRPVFCDARRSLEDVSLAKLFSDHDDFRAYSFSTANLQNLDKIINGQPAIVIFGQTCVAKANLVNVVLEQLVLPTCGGAWRWVRIVHGPISQMSLLIGSEFELVEKLESNLQPWNTIPKEDLMRPESEKQLLEPSTLLEVRICHQLLEEKVQVVVPPDSDSFETSRLAEILQKGLEDVMPVFLYSMGSDSLSEHNLKELQVLKRLFPLSPVCFIHLATNGYAWGLAGSFQQPLSHIQSSFNSIPVILANQLVSLGYISRGEQDKYSCSSSQSFGSSDLQNGIDKLQLLVSFVRLCLQSELLLATTILNEVLGRLVRKCVLCAFDMAREMQITPRRIQYAQEKEEELYKSLVAVADGNQQEITDLIEKTLEEMKEGLLELACPEEDDCECKHEMELETDTQLGVDSLPEVDLHTEVDPPGEVDWVDTEGQERVDSQAKAERAIRQQVLARLSAVVAARLAQRSVDCVAEGRVGTLQRCVASLELAGGTTDASSDASGAVQQILLAAQDVDLGSSGGGARSLLDRVVSALRRAAATLVPAPRRDAHWRRRAAVAAMRALPPPRPLAAIAHAQARSVLAASHTAFQQALARLADRLASRLEQTHEQRLAIRKLHAPRIAKLLLETTSMADKVAHGMPRLGREIGRGQYGVVFSCESWGGAGPCAVKTVVPPDDKHWNDLAMEFYYTRTIAPHDRIVRLRGSVLDHSYGGGEPAVLLVMDRLRRDLYSGLRSGLGWLTRLQVAIDVVQGIRYLHSQGLVHRDIKLKNVLLDDENRAKLTDLGFCIPEAMMSGSIVGTPVHMAPELLSGQYDSSVDVYAFGILFWYICAGHVKLPFVFERFQNKEQLWVSVKRGIRPERLHKFDDRCWALMEQCWSGDPAQRPLLGNVQPMLEAINAEYICLASQKTNNLV